MQAMQVDDASQASTSQERIRKWRRWDLDEEKVLAEAVRKHGTKNWEEVAKEMCTDRSPRMLYERWNERSRDIMAILENRTPPPMRPEKISRKEKRALKMVPSGAPEGAEQDTQLPPNLILPSAYFGARTIGARGKAMQAANVNAVVEAGERYATNACWLSQILTQQGGEEGVESWTAGVQNASKATIETLCSVVAMSDLCRQATEGLEPREVGVEGGRGGCEQGSGLGEVKKVEDAGQVEEAKGYLQAIVLRGGGYQL